MGYQEFPPAEGERVISTPVRSPTMSMREQPSRAKVLKAIKDIWDLMGDEQPFSGVLGTILSSSPYASTTAWVDAIFMRRLTDSDILTACRYFEYTIIHGTFPFVQVHPVCDKSYCHGDYHAND